MLELTELVTSYRNLNNRHIKLKSTFTDFKKGLNLITSGGIPIEGVEIISSDEEGYITLMFIDRAYRIDFFTEIGESSLLGKLIFSRVLGEELNQLNYLQFDGLGNIKNAEGNVQDEFSVTDKYEASKLILNWILSDIKMKS